MWRIANCVYRAFRNTATHRCSQDILIPFTTVCSTDDDSTSDREETSSCVEKSDINKVLKKNQFTYKNLEKLQEYLKQFSLQQLTKRLDVIKSIEPSKSEVELKALPPVSSPPPKNSEETLDSIIQSDEPCRNTLQNLSDLREETNAIINLDLALDALESGNAQLGVEFLQACTKNKPNAAALFNLGICYERGLGVEKDRAKACDYYRQASLLGHINAQFNLTLLSNDIDIDGVDDDDDDEDIKELSEQTINANDKSILQKMFSRFSLAIDYEEDQSLNDYQFDLKNQTIACLS